MLRFTLHLDITYQLLSSSELYKDVFVDFYVYYCKLTVSLQGCQYKNSKVTIELCVNLITIFFIIIIFNPKLNLVIKLMIKFLSKQFVLFLEIIFLLIGRPV